MFVLDKRFEVFKHFLLRSCKYNDLDVNGCTHNYVR